MESQRIDNAAEASADATTSTAPTAPHLRPVQVWAPPRAASGGMPAATSLRWGRDETGERGLAPSVAQMQAHQRHLERAGRNQRLRSDAELAADRAAQDARAAAVASVPVRVRFPDGYTVLWTFPNGSTGATLHEAVRLALRNADAVPFRLTQPPPLAKQSIVDSSERPKHDLVRGYGMRGGVTVHFVRTDSKKATTTTTTYVSDTVVAMAEEIVVPQINDDDDDDEKGKEKEKEKKEEPAAKASMSSTEKANKMAKFLRLAKK